MAYTAITHKHNNDLKKNRYGKPFTHDYDSGFIHESTSHTAPGSVPDIQP